MGLLGDRPETHRAGRKALDDVLFGLHFIERNGTAVGVLVESQQAAQGGRPGAGLVGLAREAPVRVFIVAARGNLQIGDGLRVPHVRVAVPPPVEVAWVWQHRQRYGVRGTRVAGREADRVAALHFLGQHVEPDPLDPARSARETSLHNVAGQPHGLEDLCALVGLQGRDAHLGHHLQHALADAFLVGIHDVGVVLDMRGIGQVAVAPCVHQGFESQVRVDRVGTEADQQAVLMDFARLAGFHD